MVSVIISGEVCFIENFQRPSFILKEFAGPLDCSVICIFRIPNQDAQSQQFIYLRMILLEIKVSVR